MDSEKQNLWKKQHLAEENLAKAGVAAHGKIGGLIAEGERLRPLSARGELEALAEYHERQAHNIRALLRALPMELPHAANEALRRLAVEAGR